LCDRWESFVTEQATTNDAAAGDAAKSPVFDLHYELDWFQLEQIGQTGFGFDFGGNPHRLGETAERHPVIGTFSVIIIVAIVVIIVIIVTTCDYH
jgi:hypothetical protein